MEFHPYGPGNHNTLAGISAPPYITVTAEWDFGHDHRCENCNALPDGHAGAHLPLRFEVARPPRTARLRGKRQPAALARRAGRVQGRARRQDHAPDLHRRATNRRLRRPSAAFRRASAGQGRRQLQARDRRLGTSFFIDNSLFIHPSHEILLDTEFAVPTLFKILPLIFTVSLSILSLVLSEFIPKVLTQFKLSRLGYNIFSFFNQRFLIELFYNRYITDMVLKLGGQTTKVLDKGSIELIGPYGLEKGLISLSGKISKLDTGVITSYALYILVGLTFYILIPYLYLIDNNLLIIILFALISLRKT